MLGCRSHATTYVDTKQSMHHLNKYSDTKRFTHYSSQVLLWTGVLIIDILYEVDTPKDWQEGAGQELLSAIVQPYSDPHF